VAFSSAQSDVHGISEVTELAGSQISAEQTHRYHWATGYCRDKDVAEVAYGSGQGLGMLNGVSRSLESGDCSEENPRHRTHTPRSADTTDPARRAITALRGAFQ
jgi:hypothetical protein